jgi:hypothetical protein
MKKWNILLLSIWLIASGIITLFKMDCSVCMVILTILGIIAGIILILTAKKIPFFHSLGCLLFAIWLIANGLIPLLDISFSGSDIILGLLALAAGITLPMKITMKINKNLGTLLLVIWLIINGLIATVKLSFEGIEIILMILPIAVGILLLFQRNK